MSELTFRLHGALGFQHDFPLQTRIGFEWIGGSMGEEEAQFGHYTAPCIDCVESAVSCEWHSEGFEEQGNKRATIDISLPRIWMECDENESNFVMRVSRSIAHEILHYLFMDYERWDDDELGWSTGDEDHWAMKKCRQGLIFLLSGSME